MTDEDYMRMALREAERAAEEGEVPTGCIIVDSGERIIGRAHNMTCELHDATAHAEMVALSQAFAAVGNERLTGCRLYVTKEPCPMCAGAIVLARLEKVIWGVSDPKRGGSTAFDIFRHPGINHHPELVSGLLESDGLSVLQRFFRARREKSVNTPLTDEGQI